MIPSLHTMYLSRRSFFKMAAAALLGVLAACAPRVTQESSSPDTPTPASATQPPIPSPIPPSATPQPSATTIPPPTDTSQPSPTQAPTSCPAEVECNQARLSAQKSRPRTLLVRNPNPTHIITALCLRDGGCVEVCPVECIVPGKPESEWPRYYIDPDTCIDCGACIPECPFGAIFPEDEVPRQYVAKGGEYINRIGICGHYEGMNHHGEPVELETVCRLKKGQMVDLTVDIQDNFDFYTHGPGYKAGEL
jgi:ferredoxin